MVQHKRVILVSGMGTTPAVLTNTVWGLAHQQHPIVPDEIVVFITKSCKELLVQKLFDDGVWNAMLSNLKREKIMVEGKLVFGETSIRVIPDVAGNEINDLREQFLRRIRPVMPLRLLLAPENRKQHHRRQNQCPKYFKCFHICCPSAS